MDVAEDLVNLVLGRRSHRVGFDPTPVADALLEVIARCGSAAPSSKNAKPWRLHVISDPDLLRWIAQQVRQSRAATDYVPRPPGVDAIPSGWASTVLESADVVAGAPAGIVIENLGRFSGGRRRLARESGQALEGALVAYTLECAGLGAAVENMWLAANALGLKAAFIGDIGVEDQAIERRLEMSGELVGILVVGYSSLNPEPKRPDDDPRARVVWHPKRRSQA